MYILDGVVRSGSALHVRGSNHVIIDGIAVLALIEFLAHNIIQIVAAEKEDFPERLAEVPVERGVDDRIEETVAVAKPEEEAGQRLGQLRLLRERPDEREHEEGQPADGEGRHDDAKGDACLALLRQLKTQFLLVRRTREAVTAVQVVAHDLRLYHWQGRRRR